MTVRDLGQKLQMQRLFWAMSGSTRLEVKLGALVGSHTGDTRRSNRASVEEWTDLDVLAVTYAPIAGLTFAVADCKTTRSRVAERVFWLRGVGDLFGASGAYLVRDDDLPRSARQLALRLSITGLDAADRQNFEEALGDAALPKAGALFDIGRRRRWQDLMSSTPSTVDRLQRFREATYWMYRDHRNLTYLPSAIKAALPALDAKALWARAVLVDLAWLYLIAVLEALDALTKLHVSQPIPAMQQLILGGEHERQEREFVAERLRAIFRDLRIRSSDMPTVDPLPEYFPDLVDLLIRLGRRRTHATEALRVLEFTAVETIASGGASWREAFPQAAPFSRKLAADVVRFLVIATGIDKRFLSSFEEDSGRDTSTSAGSSDVPVEAEAGAAPRLDRSTSEAHQDVGRGPKGNEMAEIFPPVPNVQDQEDGTDTVRRRSETVANGTDVRAER